MPWLSGAGWLPKREDATKWEVRRVWHNDPTKALQPTTRPKRRGRILKSGGLVPVGDGVGDVDQVVGDSLNI